MREWAVELQQFLTSGATNTQAKQRAVEACDDPDIREYLENLPSSLEQTDEQAFSSLIEKIAPEEMMAEAVVFQLIHRLPVMARAENVLRLPIEARAEIGEALQVLTDLCHLDIALAPSLAFMLHITGRFYSATRAFDRAREVYEAARRIREKLAESDPRTYEPNLASTLNNLGNLYRDTRAFDQAREVYEAAVHLVETCQTEGSDRRYLNKGQATAAYRFLLSEAIETPARALAFAAALRDGDACSSALGMADCQATQGVLADWHQRTGRPHALLVPTSGASDDTLTLGLITAQQMQWWRLSCQGWEALFPKEKGDCPASRFALARKIWTSLPPALQDALAPTTSEAGEILVSGDTFWSAFPWELLRFGDGGDDFLGLHRGLARIGPILAPRLSVQLQERRLGGGNKQMAVIAPHTTGKTILTGVLGEVAALKARIPQAGGELIGCETGEAAHDGWMREALAANPAILYYSGHGGIVANEEVLLLHTEPGEGKPQGLISYFGAYHLNNALAQGASFSHAPLVVLNSCVTGRTREHGGQREDLVSALLNQGAGAVIASALPIYDSVGEALGEALFSEAALTQPTMGAYLVEARRQLARGICRDTGKPTWGAWGMVHLHGNALGTPPLFVSEMKGG